VKNLTQLYQFRFPEEDRQAKEDIWRVLCEHFFQRFINENEVMLDVGCGFGEFSRFIKARQKFAVDLDPSVAGTLDSSVSFHQADARQLPFLENSSIDVAFASNFFEHLPSKAAMDEVLGEVHRVLRPGGRFVVLQPNIRLIPGVYWDFYDHLIPLTDRSCAEAFAKSGYLIDLLIPRFLPYTTKSLLPKSAALVRAYLHFKPAWRVLGKQLLIVGRKPGG
jgi:ubiquinone/menaquinone biosynthesis C-methylase UbiE